MVHSRFYRCFFAAREIEFRNAGKLIERIIRFKNFTAAVTAPWPPAPRPYSIGRLLRAEITGMHAHLIKMHGREKEEHQTGYDPNPAERRVFVALYFSMPRKISVFLKTSGKFAHRQNGMEHE